MLPERDVDCGKNWTVDEDHVGPRIENIEHLNKTVENEGRLFFLRSPYQRREWLSKRKVPNDMLGRSVHNVCKGNPGTIVQVAREIEEEIFQAMFQAEVNNRMNM